MEPDKNIAFSREKSQTSSKETEQNVEEDDIQREAGRTYVSLQVKESERSTIFLSHTQTDETQSESEPSIKSDDFGIDNLDSKLSLACNDAKQKINDIFDLKSTFLEQCDALIKQEQNKYIEELKKNSEELRKIQQLAKSYLSSVHFKDSVIGNLVEAIQKQKNQYDSCRTFYAWRIKCMDTKREKILYAVAAKHYDDMLKRRILNSWQAVVEMSWKERIEYRVRLDMQENQQRVIEDYENKVKRLQDELSESNEKIDMLQSNHKSYEDMMKQALMRGVCALNVEAMSVLYNSTETSPPPSLTNISAPLLPSHHAVPSSISSDLKGMHSCPDCMYCTSDLMSVKSSTSISPRKDILPEQMVIPQATKFHHSSTLKNIPMMGTFKVSSSAPKSHHKFVNTSPCPAPTVSVQRHINKPTSSVSNVLRSSSSRDKVRRS